MNEEYPRPIQAIQDQPAGERTDRERRLRLRQQQQKRKKQRKRRRRLFTLVGILAVVFALHNVWNSGMMQKVRSSIEEARTLYQHREALGDPGQYPEELLEALSHNEELLPFVLDYPSKKDQSVGEIVVSPDRERGIPLFLQWDERWGYAAYGDGVIGLNGCGPTCLSMVLVGLLEDGSLHPKRIADYSMANGYITETSATQWALMTEGARALGLLASEVSLSEEQMAEQLQNGHPIICSMRPGDFTTTGHFIVLYRYQNGCFYVNDPNSKKRSEQSFSYEQLSGQIKAMWSYELP